MQHRLPLNHLNTFAAAAEHLSFQEAAEVLYVSPSAVSHQIRNLEKILDYKLFDRLDKKVRLTPQGERLFTEIKNPLKQLHEASRKALRGKEDNTLALSVAPFFATSWLLPRLNDFYAAHPDISLSVVASADITDFSSTPFDASIRMGIGDWENTTSIPLFNNQLVAVCHPSLLKNSNALMTPTEIAKHPLIFNSIMPGTWQKWFKSAGLAMPSKKGNHFQVQGFAQVVEAVQSGQSIGIVDKNFIRHDIKSGRLSIACEHVLYGDEGYYLTYPKSVSLLPSLQFFQDWLCSRIETSKANDNQ